MSAATITSAAALSLILAMMPATEMAGPANTTQTAPEEAGHRLLADALTRVVPGDVRNVRITAWQAMSIAPMTETVIGRALLDAGGAAPIEVAFRASIDLDRGDVMQLSYHMVEPARRAGGAPTVIGEALRNRIGGELVAQFPDQPMDFRITGISGSTRTANHLVVAGEGISDFFADGKARTPFVATFAMPSAQLVKFDYDLVSMPEGTGPLATR